MQNIFRKKIRKNLPANHHNDVVFVADKVYCINKSENPKKQFFMIFWLSYLP